MKRNIIEWSGLEQTEIKISLYIGWIFYNGIRVTKQVFHFIIWKETEQNKLKLFNSHIIIILSIF